MTRHFHERAKALWSQSRLSAAKSLGFTERDYAFALRLDAEQEHIRRKTELKLQTIETRKEPKVYEFTTVMETGMVGFRQQLLLLNQAGWEVVPGSIYATTLERDSRSDGKRYMERYFAASLRREIAKQRTP